MIKAYSLVFLGRPRQGKALKTVRGFIMSDRSKQRHVHAWRRTAIKRLLQEGEAFLTPPKNSAITALLHKHNIVIEDGEYEYIKQKPQEPKKKNKELQSGVIVKQPNIPKIKQNKVKQPKPARVVQPQTKASEGEKQLIVMPYEEYIRSPYWHRLRKQALERDGYRCRFCNSKENLNVHHRYYPKRFGEWSEDCLDALTTFCEKHHALLHGKEPSGLKELMMRS
jgi:hypothetical protein